MENTVAENLKKLRAKLGKTQMEMAEALNVNESTYRRYERTDGSCSVQALCKICETFSVAPDFLLFGIEPEKSKRSEVFEMKIYKEEDRVMVAGILNKNGYATCFVKRKKAPNGRAVEYLVRAVELKESEGLDDAFA